MSFPLADSDAAPMKLPFNSQACNREIIVGILIRQTKSQTQKASQKVLQLASAIVQAAVVFRKTSCCWWLMLMPLIVVLIGQFCHEVNVCQDVKVAVVGRLLFYCNFRSFYGLSKFDGLLV